MNIEQPLTLTVEQAAKLLGIGRSTAYELVHTGDIPSLRLGRRIVVPLCQIAHRLGVACSEVSDAVSDDETVTVTTGVDASEPAPPSPGEPAQRDSAATLF